METTEFWAIISRVHQGTNGAMDKKCILLKQELDTLSDGDLKSSAAHFDRLTPFDTFR